MVVGLLFTLQYEDAFGDIHLLKVHKVVATEYRTDALLQSRLVTISVLLLLSNNRWS